MRVFKEFGGTVSAFRVGVPRQDGVGAIKVGDAWLEVNLDGYMHGREVDGGMLVDQSNIEQSIRTLETIAGAGCDAIAGAYVSGDGAAELEWLLSARGNLIPLSRHDLRKKGLKMLARAMPWLLLCLLAFIWSIANIMDGFRYTILLVMVAIPLMVFLLPAVMGLGLIGASWLSRSKRMAERALQRHLDEPVGRKFPNGFFGNPVDRHDALVVDRRRQEETSAEPHLYCVRGRACGVTMQRTHVGTAKNRIDLKCFEFSLEGEKHTLFASRTWGGGNVFLAEGDRVEVVVAAYEQRQPGSPRLVWAMRNLEDGRVYASHRVMAPLANPCTRPLVGPFRMTQFTRRARQRFRVFFMATWLLAWILMNGISTGIGGKIDELALIVSTFAPPLIWGIGIELPILLSDIKWRAGRPSKRQRLTERVYALLGIGSALAPPPTVIEV
ncbi:hypothetical protein [Achromobacter aloeverae]